MTNLVRALLVLVIPAAAYAQAPHGVNPAYFDTTCAPCKDLYRHANGAWLDTVRIPADQGGWGLFYELFERNQQLLHAVVDSLAAAPTPDKVGTYYGTCMDTARTESDGAAPLRAEMARIDAVRTVPALRVEVARLHRIGTTSIFTFTSAQDAKHSTDVIADASQGASDFRSATSTSERIRLRRRSATRTSPTSRGCWS